MEATNDSLKAIANSVELIKTYLERKDAENAEMLCEALQFLEKAIERLSKSTNI